MEQNFSDLVRGALDEQTFVSLVLSGPQSGGDTSPRQTVRPVQIRGDWLLQWTTRDGKQERHENLTPDASRKRTQRLFPSTYRNARLVTTSLEVEARITKRGDVRLSQRQIARPAASPLHNRERSYLIPEGTPCPFLEAIGVMTTDGRVRAPMQHKFRQINRYLEFVNDILDSLPAQGPLHVVDFGCGKSGLTFALHHLLTRIHQREVHLVGLDRNASVLATCREIAERLQLDGLEFCEGDIATYRTDSPVHLAVSLHACDTATDDAIAQAIHWNSDVILAVPCCQHELSPQLASDTFSPLLKHGILRERLAADITDTLRAALLERHGYRTQIVEFIELEHTPKNLLIRAVRQKPGPAEEKMEQMETAYRRLKKVLGVESFQLERLLAQQAGGE